jgi:hypothetical protein
MEKIISIRDTPLKNCIGARILDITGVDTEDFLAGEDNTIYFHLDNGETLYATMGVDGQNLLGMLNMEAPEGEDEQSV